MFPRLIACFIALGSFPATGFSATINLRKSCDRWELVPANEALNSPITALLQCTSDTHTWLAVQIKCDAQKAEIEFRYRPSYPIVPPLPAATEPEVPEITAVAENVSLTDQTAEPGQQDTEPAPMPLGEKEMLFFDFPKLGVTSVVKYDFETQDWGYIEKEPLATLFRSLITGNYADVSLLATETTERLPLRGSTRAIGPVVETCRVAKRKLDKEAALTAQD